MCHSVRNSGRPRNQRHVAAGAADVQRDEIGGPGALSQLMGRHHPRHGTGHQGLHREPSHGPRGADAAVGLHQEGMRAREMPPHGFLHAGEVLLHARAEIGVQHGGGGALVLAPHRVHLRRQRDEKVRITRADVLRRQPLVGRIHVGEQERDGQGVDALLHEPGHGLVDGIQVQGHQHLSGLVETFGNLGDPAPRHEPFAPGIEDVEDLVALPLAGDLVDVAETAGGEETGAAALLLEHGVERVGGAVEQVGQGFGAPLGAQVRQHSVEHLQRRRGIGGHLADLPDLPRPLLQDRDVREGSADIDADAQSRCGFLHFLRLHRTLSEISR